MSYEKQRNGMVFFITAFEKAEMEDIVYFANCGIYLEKESNKKSVFLESLRRFGQMLRSNREVVYLFMYRLQSEERDTDLWG